MSQLARILKVRRAREVAIRARIEALHDEVRRLNALVLSRGQLDCMGEDLAEFGVRDAKIKAEVERRLAQIARLEDDIQNENDALRQNLVGQEKLSILIEEDVELKRR
jgi:hypothetical protein